MPRDRTEQLEKAKAALKANRDVAMLGVYPGPRGADVTKDRLRRLGRHMHWYIGEFQHRPGISGPVQCEEVPTFSTKRAAEQFLADVKTA